MSETPDIRDSISSIATPADRAWERLRIAVLRLQEHESPANAASVKLAERALVKVLEDSG